MARPQKLASGAWRVRWVDEDGKRRGKTFKLYRDAQVWLRKEMARVEDVKRGLQLPEAPDKTFDDLVQHWLSTRAALKRNPRDDQCIIRCHLRPAFAGQALRSIGTAQVRNFNLSLLHLSPNTQRNIQTLLGSMFREAAELGWLLRPPQIKKTKVRFNRADYRYLRTKQEISTFLAAAEVEPNPMVYWLYFTAICTGMRAGELAGLRCEDIDLERRLITVQRSFNGPTKGGDARYVPILDVLVEVLTTLLAGTAPGEHIFKNAIGGPLKSSGRIFQETLYRVLKRSELPTVVNDGKTTRYIRFHDLRHTFASHWLMDGGEIFKLQRILGHKSMEMTQRYSHLAPNAFAGDLGRISLS